MNQKRISTLAKFLDITLADITTDEHTKHLYTTPDGDYLVLTDEESNAAAVEYIKSSLWAFNADFIFDMCFNSEDYSQTKKRDIINSLSTMQAKCCESANPVIMALINGSCGIEDFTAAAINADGRGHFIAWYDGEENEQDGYYIYRVN